MKKRTLIGIYFVSVISAAILGIILSAIFLEHFTGSEFPFPIPVEYIPALQAMMTFKTVISFVNMALIFLMLGIYIDLYRKIKTNFTAGLLLLIIVLLLNAMSANPLLFLRFEGAFLSPSMGFIIPDVLTTIALTVLFYLSLE
ncbi:MAG: hypothetical protein ACTSSE_08840 [Candidatus Thorarchaeota archaeon]